ncbi:MAG: hypothetical protein Satyrvirus27_6 [Satyrvirus sp.]|uniref:Uncharacterized protein n=1 Tax=Satyrvirus sp. TaxID=2487771 RepID=A0A3G5AJF4_9VIRU|nr:MAG: hypothetical protein Satyrvirus27_6 [Satyrvirus sp.]
MNYILYTKILFLPKSYENVDNERIIELIKNSKSKYITEHTKIYFDDDAAFNNVYSENAWNFYITKKPIIPTIQQLSSPKIIVLLLNDTYVLDGDICCKKKIIKFDCPEESKKATATIYVSKNILIKALDLSFNQIKICHGHENLYSDHTHYYSTYALGIKSESVSFVNCETVGNVEKLQNEQPNGDGDGDGEFFGLDNLLTGTSTKTLYFVKCKNISLKKNCFISSCISFFASSYAELKKNLFSNSTIQIDVTTATLEKNVIRGKFHMNMFNCKCVNFLDNFMVLDRSYVHTYIHIDYSTSLNFIDNIVYQRSIPNVSAYDSVFDIDRASSLYTSNNYFVNVQYLASIKLYSKLNLFNNTFSKRLIEVSNYGGKCKLMPLNTYNTSKNVTCYYVKSKGKIVQKSELDDLAPIKDNLLKIKFPRKTNADTTDTKVFDEIEDIDQFIKDNFDLGIINIESIKSIDEELSAIKKKNFDYEDDEEYKKVFEEYKNHYSNKIVGVSMTSDKKLIFVTTTRNICIPDRIVTTFQ